MANNVKNTAYVYRLNIYETDWQRLRQPYTTSAVAFIFEQMFKVM